MKGGAHQWSKEEGDPDDDKWINSLDNVNMMYIEQRVMLRPSGIYCDHTP